MSEAQQSSKNGRSRRLTKRQEILMAAVFFAVVFGGLMGYELSTRGLLTQEVLAALVILSVLGGLLFAIGFWYLYLRKHRL